MATIMFLNLKGGVAKTTTAVAVAECLAARAADRGRKVLVIDADHQCGASELLLGEGRVVSADKNRRTFHDLLATMLSDDFDGSAGTFSRYLAPEASRVRGLKSAIYALPCSVRIDDFHTNMAKARKGFKSNPELQAAWRRNLGALKKWLDEFQYVVVDCPPSLAPQVRLLLRVADCYILPSIPDRVSVRGARALCGRLSDHGFKTPPLGMLWTLYRSQVERHATTVSLAEKRAAVYATLPKPFKTVIPNSTDIVKALEEHESEPRTFHAKYQKAAKTIEELCDEIVTRLQKIAPPVNPKAVGRPASAPRPQRYYGTFQLRDQRAGRDAGEVAERILSYLTAVDGSRVNVSLDIEAEFSLGAPAKLVRVVTENARGLRCSRQGFEGA